MKYLCVFCGSSKGRPAIYEETTRRFGEALARRGWGLVYGGGHIGWMGVLAYMISKRSMAFNLRMVIGITTNICEEWQTASSWPLPL